jgi:hypothetical protein
MPVKISIPASELIDQKKDPLVLIHDQRCSRCDQSPAEFYEIHRISIRIGVKKNRLISKKYDISRHIQLKINICETCYQSDFLTHPDSLDRNGSRLSRIAKFHSITWTLGALFAALGFILLTPIVPDTGLLQSIKSMWQIPIGVGILVLLLTWFSQKKYQNQVLRELEKTTPNFRPRKRAEVNAPILESSKDWSLTALEIKMENEPWAMEAAKSHGWTYETAA